MAHCLPSTLYIQQIGDIIVGDSDGKVTFDSRQMKENEKQKAPLVLWNAGEGPHWDENPSDVPIKIIQSRIEIDRRPRWLAAQGKGLFRGVSVEFQCRNDVTKLRIVLRGADNE